jgi:hypothetical protein
MISINKKNLIIQATIVLLLLFSSGAGAIHHTMNVKSTESFTIESSFYEDDTPTITVTITPPSLLFGHTTLAGHEFTTIDLPGEGVSTTIGAAQLPVLSRFIEVPQGAQPDLVIDSVSWETTSLTTLQLPSQVIPVQPSLIKIDGASVPFTMDDTYYMTTSFVPTPVVQVQMIGELRERNIAFLQVFPVQYNPATGEVRIMTQCSLHINLPGSDLTQTSEKIDRYATPAFEPLLQTSLVNYGSLQGSQPMKPKQEGYLIIVGDDLYDAIQPLVDWKDTKGFDVTVTKTSEIPGGPTKENIKSYIVDAYDNWPIPPSYILLVGDVAQIPTWTGSETGTCTDLYYVTIDAGNYFADIIISRFSGSTPEQITNMVDKTLYYETGTFPDESWIKKAAFMASNDNYQVSEGTHNYVIDTYLAPNNYTCDKLYSHTYSATTAQVTAALNDGRSLAIYSGHGSTDSWADGPPYSQSNINALTNDGMYPFVCSHACLTNQFTVSECFGETWVRAPNKGGLAFWGATTYSYWDEDDILEKSMFKAWWEDNIETIGGMTNMGLYYLYEHYGGGGMSQYYFEEYNVLGDSSVIVWRGQTNINTPPSTPEKPDGPGTGEIGLEYTFTTSSTDAQNNDIYYMITWGDSITDWLGPYASGETIGFTHTWEFPGDYTIKIKAKDTEGLESDWSEASTIQILAMPRIEIGTIAGGFGSITAEIRNAGAGDATNVPWTITLDGGLVFLGKETTGTFLKIMPGFAPKAKTTFLFGFGTIDIHVTAGDVEKTATAKLLGPFVVNIQ